ncbi:MAG: SprT family zinc-dependent metalloprotease [Prolixibacteraceae bacterium]|jgi:predicted metal-dependent hydrolase|nr:SprT family zinc-dependent metalloprotease [Prolixibacteraceae bacterium]
MSTNYYKIENVGVVKFTRRRNSKRITMRIKSDGMISVNYPWLTPKKQVSDFVINNTEWIKKQQKAISEKKARYHIGDIIELSNSAIKIQQVEKTEMMAYPVQQSYVVDVPAQLDPDSERVQNFISKVVVEACRVEAKIYLPLRLLELAREHNFNYNKLFLKNLKSRWGSCSSMGNINLNVHLMRLPDHLINYIILHELVHTVEANHGAGFWALLDKVTNGNAKKLDKEVKKYNLIIT